MTGFYIFTVNCLCRNNIILSTVLHGSFHYKYGPSKEGTSQSQIQIVTNTDAALTRGEFTSSLQVLQQNPVRGFCGGTGPFFQGWFQQTEPQHLSPSAQGCGMRGSVCSNVVGRKNSVAKWGGPGELVSLRPRSTRGHVPDLGHCCWQHRGTEGRSLYGDRKIFCLPTTLCSLQVPQERPFL